MKTLWIESEPQTWECGEPGCCFESWTNYRITVDGEVHETDDRHTSSNMLLPLLLPFLGYDNWSVSIDDREMQADSYDPTRTDAYEFIATNQWDAAGARVLKCHLLIQSQQAVLLDRVYEDFPAEGVDDDRWIVTQFLAELGWYIEWT